MLASIFLGLSTVAAGGALNLQALIAAATFAAWPAGSDPVACELVDQTSAEAVLGSGATNPIGAAVPEACRYDKADASLILMVQVFPLVMYDVMPITPETPVDIGDRGRYGVGSSGSASVQFAKGEFAVTLTLSPSIGAGSASPLVAPLLEIARIAADRMSS